MALAPALISSSFGEADVFPSKEMQGLLGFSPGGGVDRSSRIVMQAWRETLGMKKPFKSVYLPGAGTLLSHRKMMRDPNPDGHLVHFVPVTHTAWIFELKNPDFALDDIAWVGNYFADPDILLVRKDSKWDRIDQFIDDARKAKKPITVSVGTAMAAEHAAAVILRELSGANLKIIAFKGGSKARNAVAGGHVDACVAPYWGALHVYELTKAIGIFSDYNPAPHLWKPVLANDVLDFKMPILSVPMAVQVNGAIRSKYPERYKKLVTSLRETLESKAFRTLADKQELTPFVKYMSPEECKQFIDFYLNLVGKYKPAMERDMKSMM
jgi:tripartite-type tricarboxylate transporter receptor subunit TctC